MKIKMKTLVPPERIVYADPRVHPPPPTMGRPNPRQTLTLTAVYNTHIHPRQTLTPNHWGIIFTSKHYRLQLITQFLNENIRLNTYDVLVDRIITQYEIY